MKEGLSLDIRITWSGIDCFAFCAKRESIPEGFWRSPVAHLASLAFWARFQRKNFCNSRFSPMDVDVNLFTPRLGLFLNIGTKFCPSRGPHGETLSKVVTGRDGEVD